MVGAIWGDLAALFWKQDKVPFFRKSVSENSYQFFAVSFNSS